MKNQKPRKSFMEWAEESKKIKQQFARGATFAQVELADINERVATSREKELLGTA